MLVITISRFSYALNQPQIVTAVEAAAKKEQVKQSLTSLDNKKKKIDPLTIQKNNPRPW
jgi:hypothetical protein